MRQSAGAQQQHWLYAPRWGSAASGVLRGLLTSPPPPAQMISELGNFYRANGPRTRLTDEARRAVLGAIERGEAALEREKQARRDAKKSGR